MQTIEKNEQKNEIEINHSNNNFSATLNGSNAKKLKVILEVMDSCLSGPINMEITPDYIRMGAMQNSSSVFFMFILEKDFFKSKSSDFIPFFVDLYPSELKRVFSKEFHPSDEISINFDLVSNNMIFSTTSDNNCYNSTSKIKFHVSHPEFDLLDKVMTIPLLCSVLLNKNGFSTIFERLIKYSSKECSLLEISVDKEREIIFGSTNHRDTKTEYHYKPTENPTFDNNPIIQIDNYDNDIYESPYGLLDLEKLSHLDSITEKTTLQFDEEHPLRIIFELENAKVVYLMAPLEKDDDWP